MAAVVYLLLLSILLVLIKRYLIKANDQLDGAKLPPGPSQLPIIGSMHHLLIGTSIPQRRLLELANKYGPLMHLRIGEIHTTVVTSPEVAEEMLKTHDLIFAERQALTTLRVLTYKRKDVAFSPYGAYWRQMRKICVLELLSTKRVRSFRSIREDEAFDLVRSVYAAGRSPVNLSMKFISFTTNVVSRAAFGNECMDKEAMVSLMKDVLVLIIGMNFRDFFPSNKLLSLLGGSNRMLKRCHREIDHIFNRMIHEHMRKKLKNGDPGEEDEDLVDVLLRLQAEGGLEFPLTMDHIKATIFDMFVGGIDTSAIVLEWAMSELMCNPESMQKAQAEVREALTGKEKVGEGDIQGLHYMRLVIKETIRMHPPAPLLAGRWCRETCKIGGYTIPEKSAVLVNVWAMNRDPRYWDEPNRFKPERFDGSPIDYKGTNFEYIPFGAGRRMCPGIQFGIASVELPLAMLLYHFDWRLLDGMEGKDLDMTEASGSGSPRKSKLRLIAIPPNMSYFP